MSRKRNKIASQLSRHIHNPIPYTWLFLLNRSTIARINMCAKQTRYRRRRSEWNRETETANDKAYHGWENVEHEMHLNRLRRRIDSTTNSDIVFSKHSLHWRYDELLVLGCAIHSIDNRFRQSGTVCLQLDFLLILIHFTYRTDDKRHFVLNTCASTVINDLHGLRMGECAIASIAMLSLRLRAFSHKWVGNDRFNLVLQIAWFHRKSIIYESSRAALGCTENQIKSENCMNVAYIAIWHVCYTLYVQTAQENKTQKKKKKKEKIDKEKILLINNLGLWHFVGTALHTHGTRNHLFIDPACTLCISPQHRRLWPISFQSFFFRFFCFLRFTEENKCGSNIHPKPCNYYFCVNKKSTNEKKSSKYARNIVRVNHRNKKEGKIFTRALLGRFFADGINVNLSRRESRVDTVFEVCVCAVTSDACFAVVMH